MMERAIWSGWHRWAWAVVLVVGLMVALVSPVLAADDQFDQLQRPSLAGLTGVYVLVEHMTPDEEREGLPKSTLQTDVELKLRQAGIRVLTQIESFLTPGSPYLYLNLTIGRSDFGIYAYCIRLELNQAVRLDRDPTITSRGITWRTSAVGTIGAKNLPKVHDSVRDMVDQFINAYLAANPKR